MTTGAQGAGGAASGSGSIRPILVIIGFALVVVGLLGLGISGLGYKHQMWSLRAGLTTFRYAGFAVWAGALISLIALLSGRSRPFLAIVGLIAGIIGGMVWTNWVRAAKSVPPI